MSTPSLKDDSNSNYVPGKRTSQVFGAVVDASPGILFAVWLLLMALLGGAWFYFGNTVLLHLLYAAFGLSYVVFLPVWRRLPGPTPLDGPIAAVVLVNAVAIVASPYESLALEEGLMLSGGVLVFYGLHDLRALSTDALIHALLTVVGLLALIALIYLGLNYKAELELVRVVRGTIGIGDLSYLRAGGIYHPNALAIMLNLAMPFALALFLRPALRIQRTLAGVVLCLGLPALLLTASRGGWLAFFVAASAFALAYWGPVRLRKDLRAVTHWSRMHLLPVSAGLFLACAATLLGGAYLWQEQPAWLLRETASHRLEMASVGFDMVRDSPLLGFGPGAYGLLYNAYGGEILAGRYAHNAYIDALVDVGIVGALLYAIAALAVLAVLFRAAHQRNPRLRALGAACIASVASLLVAGAFEVPFELGTVVLFTAIVGAVAVRLGGDRQPPKGVPSAASRLVVLALFAVTFYVWTTADLAYLHFSRSSGALAQGELDEAATEARAAVDFEPDAVGYRLHAGVTEALIYQEQLERGPEGGNPAILESAVEHLRATTKLDPKSFLAQLNLALALRLKGEEASAAEAARLALEMSPQKQPFARVKDASIAATAGTVLEWAGHTEEAIQAFAVAVRLDPTLTQSTYWRTSPAREQLRLKAIESAGVPPCELGRAAAIYGSSEDDLGGLIEECRSSLGDRQVHASVAMMLAAQGRDMEALREAREALANFPEAGAARTALGIALAGSDLTRARTEWLAADRRGDPDAALLLAISYDAGGATYIPVRSWSHSKRPVPSPILENLSSKPYAHRSLLGLNYYVGGLNRTPPEQLMIVGDWDRLESPRVVLTEAILEKYRAN